VASFNVLVSGDGSFEHFRVRNGSILRLEWEWSVNSRPVLAREQLITVQRNRPATIDRDVSYVDRNSHERGHLGRDKPV